jgi:hypothetical protein
MQQRKQKNSFLIVVSVCGLDIVFILCVGSHDEFGSSLQIMGRTDEINCILRDSFQHDLEF